ncbi:hypothetical protein MNBD_GAMMA04-1814 [hydrothermal vent metagenome]|uniref:Uncharacterized protein n=1 Tax=hydrothermal vent metagenome TaxID=652676 RepID=A0A3B0VLT8_9ZZZZ
MFDLFRHYRIEPKLHRYAVLFSLSVVLGWLYFSFIEKSFVGKMLSGEALIVDLVLGLPLVFMFTVIVYACAYWLCKWLVIFFLPHAMIPYPLKNKMSDDETERQEETHGEEYWQNNNDTNQANQEKNKPPNKNNESD